MARRPRTSRSYITAGSDGNLWYTSFANNRIGRITPAGAITTFADPAGTTSTSGPQDITAGPDGNVWFASAANDRIGRVEVGGVAPAPARPDALIRNGTTEAFRGNDVYNTTGANQTRTVASPRNRTVTLSIRVQNDRPVNDSLRVQGAAGNTGAFRVRYYAGCHRDHQPGRGRRPTP